MPSTVIRQIEYDTGTATLYVTFTSGARYAYFDVPRPQHEAFLAAFSKGRFFGEHIRPHYRSRKLPPPHDEPLPAVPKPDPPGLGPNPGGLLGAAARPESRREMADAVGGENVIPFPRRPSGLGVGG